jgi:hypothetical protein
VAEEAAAVGVVVVAVGRVAAAAVRRADRAAAARAEVGGVEAGDNVVEAATGNDARRPHSPRGSGDVVVFVYGDRFIGVDSSRLSP